MSRLLIIATATLVALDADLSGVLAAGPDLGAVQRQPLNWTAIIMFLIFGRLVAEKVRDIGALRAIGATPAGIRACFLMQAFLIGFVGLAHDDAVVDAIVEAAGEAAAAAVAAAAGVGSPARG